MILPEADMWLDRWAVSYPTVRVAEIHPPTIPSANGNNNCTYLANHPRRNCGWCGTRCRSLRVFGMALSNRHTRPKTHSPYVIGCATTNRLPDDPNHTLQRIRAPLPHHALVIGKDDPIAQPTGRNNKPTYGVPNYWFLPHRAFKSSPLRHSNGVMKLLQEMLLSYPIILLIFTL